MPTRNQGAILLAVPKRDPADPGEKIGAAGLRALVLRAPDDGRFFSAAPGVPAAL